MMLVTLLFLLSSGAPASKAYVTCPALIGAVAGSDEGEEILGGKLIVDSRGAVVFETEPKTIDCFASHGTEVFMGPIAITTDRKVIRIYLKEGTHGSTESE